MSGRHAVWLVLSPLAVRRFDTYRAAARYLRHHEPRLGPATLVGLD